MRLKSAIQPFDLCIVRFSSIRHNEFATGIRRGVSEGRLATIPLTAARNRIISGCELRSPIHPSEEKSMTKERLAIGAALCAAFTPEGVLFAQQPRVDVGERQGNMRAAQQLIQQAWQKLTRRKR
jgi:hypothetical protein